MKQETKQLTPKETFIEIAKARRVLYLTLMITERENNAILNKMAKFRKEHVFTVTQDELY